ncbi:FtsX-like permease family protein, partial [bacterium]|nr:FtsX-like permease family protein [bacterium]
DPGFILLRLQGEDITGTMARLRKTWESVVPEAQFQSRFVEDSVERQYREDRRRHRVITSATIMAVLLAMLGLTGMTVMQVGRRGKEIGIRKVLGATVTQILELLSRETLLLVPLANLIAAPVAYLLIRRQLQSFAYHFDINAWLLLIPVAASLLTALAIVVIMSYRMATTNPTEMLRDE